MTRRSIAAALIGLSCAVTSPAASGAAGFIPPPPEPVAFPYEVMGPRDFQVFAAPWTPPSEPHCVAIRSAKEWERNFHPAPVMHGNQAFAPPPAFWRDHIVLLFARAMPMGNSDDAIQVEGVNEIAGRLEIQLGFHIVQSSATMNAWRGIVIGRPDWLDLVSFRAGNETLCSFETNSTGG